MTKDENPNILTSLVKTHCLNTYSSHLHIYTDGSLLENNDCGAAFIIPQYRIVKSYYIGSLLSIFTAELTAIMMALTCLLDLIGENIKIVLFVDSLSVLKTLENFGLQTRADLVYEIYYLLYQLFMKNNNVTFCWIPSHCGISGNEQVDKAAKRGAQRKANYIHLPIPISIEEYNNHLQNISFSNFFDNSQNKNFLKNYLIFCHNKFQNKSINYYRKITSLSFKLKLNSLKTKYNKLIKCKCGNQITIQHLLLHCTLVKHLFPKQLYEKITTSPDVYTIFSDLQSLLDCAEVLTHSPINNLL